MPIPVFPQTYIKNGLTVRFPNPAKGYTVTAKPNTLTLTFDSGHEQRRIKGQTLRAFQVSYNYLEKEATDILTTFFMQVLTVTAFNYTLEGVTYLCRFDGEFTKELSLQNGKNKYYKVSLKLNQVLS